MASSQVGIFLCLPRLLPSPRRGSSPRPARGPFVVARSHRHRRSRRPSSNSSSIVDLVVHRTRRPRSSSSESSSTASSSTASSSTRVSSSSAMSRSAFSPPLVPRGERVGGGDAIGGRAPGDPIRHCQPLLRRPRFGSGLTGPLVRLSRRFRPATGGWSSSSPRLSRSARPTAATTATARRRPDRLAIRIAWEPSDLPTPDLPRRLSFRRASSHRSCDTVNSTSTVSVFLAPRPDQRT